MIYERQHVDRWMRNLQLHFLNARGPTPEIPPTKRSRRDWAGFEADTDFFADMALAQTYLSDGVRAIVFLSSLKHSTFPTGRPEHWDDKIADYLGYESSADMRSELNRALNRMVEVLNGRNTDVAPEWAGDVVVG